MSAETNKKVVKKSKTSVSISHNKLQEKLDKEEKEKNKITGCATKKKDNKKLRAKVVLPIAALFIGIFVLALSTSYAFFTTQTTSKKYIVYSGTLQVDFEHGDDVFNVTNAVPMSNANGLASEDNEYRFAVKNNGSAAAKYHVRFEVLNDDPSSYIPLEYIKLSYSANYGETFTAPVKLSDLDYNLVFTEDKVIQPTNTDHYLIKLW